MEESKKKKKKRDPWYGQAFAPLFRMHSTTPKTTPDPGCAAPVAPAVGESVLINLRNLTEAANPDFVGYASPVSQVLMKQSTPGAAGPGFQPVEPGQGGKYDFNRSPGLGFKSAAGWRVWSAVMEIIGKSQMLTPTAILQAAMQRAGVRTTDIDTAETRLLEMGIEWYLSDPGKFPQPKDGVGGIPGGVPFGQLKTV